MKNSYSGFIIFLRQNKRGQGFGFIYSPESDKTFHFSEQVIAANYGKPEVGNSVDFVEVIGGPEDKGPTACEVRGGSLPNSAGAVISLTAVADVYRHPITQLSQMLGIEDTKDGRPAFISIPQLLTVRDLVAHANSGERAKGQPGLRRVGKVVRYKEENGYGFIEQAGFDDVFVHVNSASPGILTSGAWVVFTQDTNPKDSTKLRATNVKALAAETAYLRANMGAFSASTLQVLLENGEESLRVPIISQRVARLDSASDFEAAKHEIQLIEKHLPHARAHYCELIGKQLHGEAAWHWWHYYGSAALVPDAVLRFYREVAYDVIYDGDAGIDVQGQILLDKLPLAHFIGFFQSLWPYAKVLESFATEQGESLIKDCNNSVFLKEVNPFGYGRDAFTLRPSEETQRKVWLVRYLAALDVEGLAEKARKSLEVILPIPEFVASLPTDTDVYYLVPLLIYDIPEVNAVVVPHLFQQMGTVETEVAFARLVEILTMCRKARDEASVELATELALRGCSSFFQVKLWTLGLVPGADIYQLLEFLSSSEVVIHLQDGHVPVRLPAATTLLLRAAETGDDASISQGVRVLIESRQLLPEADFELLLQVYPAAGSLYSEVNGWLESQQLRPVYGTLLTWLLVLREQATAEMMPLINHLAAAERAEFLHHIVEVDSTRLLGLDSAFLIQWLLLLKEGARLDIQPQLVQSRRNDLLLDLWLGGHSEYFDFARYYLLVATLEKEQQFLFLRKVFGLMASGAVQLTVDDLDTIPRHSRDDDNLLNRRLDYSIDLVLRVLTKLKRNSAYPTENDIVDCLIAYAGNSTKELLQFNHLFAHCPGRTSIQYGRPEEIVRVFGTIGSKIYPAASDKSYIIVGGEQLPVVQDTFIYKDKRYAIKWKIEEETYWPWSYYNELSNGKRNVTCCEGEKALVDDRTTKSPVWWCYGSRCHKANQADSLPEQWEQFVLKDFIQIAGLRFDEKAYYRVVGLVNRINELLTKMYCKECGTMLRPSETSKFNFYRLTKFKCTVDSCSSYGKVIYLNRCLNGNCGSVIDSRVSARCNYDDLGEPGWNGMYICNNCGGCCSKNNIRKQMDKMIQNYGEAGAKNQSQYKSFVKQLELGLYHADRFKSYCHKCLSPMKRDSEKKPNYSCPTCDGVKYMHSVAYLTVYNKKKASTIDAEQDYHV